MKDMLTSRGIDVRKLRLKDDYIAAMHSSNLTSSLVHLTAGVEAPITTTFNTTSSSSTTKMETPSYIKLFIEPIINLFEKATKEHPTLFVKRNLETEWKVSVLFPSHAHF